ncbi:MAG: hypothetical protein ACO20H_08180 [Bacteriovoracaceae bacterium]
MRIIICLLFWLPIAAKAITYDELSPQEKSKVSSGQIVVKLTPIDNAPWPSIDVFSTVKASPLESLALFLALDIQKDYVPNLLKSRPIKHISATEVHTEYIMDLPWPIPNGYYVHGSDFKKTPQGYRAMWYMVQSDSANSVNGFAQFNQDGLFHYHSRVSPKSALATLLKGLMVKDVEKTVEAIRSFIETTIEKNPKLLKKYVSYIERSLRGEFVYEAQIRSE